MQNMSQQFDRQKLTHTPVSIQAILCVNTFSQTHEEEAATRGQYVGSDMTNSFCLLQLWIMLHHVWKDQSPPCGTQIFPDFPL